MLDDLRAWRSHRNSARFLLAYLLINDGSVTVVLVATLYIRATFGASLEGLLKLILLYHVIAAPATLAVGRAWPTASACPRHLPQPRRVDRGVVLMVFAQGDWAPWAIAGALGSVVASTNALCRALFARLVPDGRSAQFFGFNAVVGRMSAALGPLVYAGGERCDRKRIRRIAVGPRIPSRRRLRAGRRRYIPGGERADPANEGGATVTPAPPSASSSVLAQFADYTFSRDAGLRRGGEPVALPPKIAAALALLVERRGGLVTRDELVRAVWGDQGASNDSIARCLYQMRQLVPLPDGKPLVRTVHRTGFRLAVPLREPEPQARTTAHKLVTGAPTSEPFDMLQQARELVGMMMPADIQAALVAVQRVNARWPDYAPAWSFRADLHMLRAMRWFAPPRTAAAEARDAAQRAIAIDAEYAPSWAVLGVVQALIERDTASGLAHLERAIELDPSYFMARGYHALALIAAGRLGRARAEARDALARNSLSSRLQLWYPWRFSAAGRPRKRWSTSNPRSTARSRSTA